MVLLNRNKAKPPQMKKILVEVCWFHHMLPLQIEILYIWIGSSRY